MRVFARFSALIFTVCSLGDTFSVEILIPWEAMQLQHDGSQKHLYEAFLYNRYCFPSTVTVSRTDRNTDKIKTLKHLFTFLADSWFQVCRCKHFWGQYNRDMK